LRLIVGGESPGFCNKAKWSAVTFSAIGAAGPQANQEGNHVSDMGIDRKTEKLAFS